MVKFGTSGLRGLAEGFDKATVHRYVSAFLKTCTQTISGPVFVGSDLRASSPLIKDHVCRSIVSNGRTAFDAGALPTPALALWAMHNGAPAIMVTGSHIPAQYNGLKFYRADGELRKTDEAPIVAQAEQVDVPLAQAASTLDCHAEALAFYRLRYLEAMPSDALNGLRVGVYLHSAVGGELLAEILEAQGASVERFGACDKFIPVDTEALEDDDALGLCRSVLGRSGLDAIVSTDADGDRSFVLDETGEQINGDILGLLTAKTIGARSIATPLTSTSAIERSGWFERVERTAIGSPYVVEAMIDAGLPAPVVGFEANGGVLLANASAGKFQMAPLATRDAVLPIMAVLALARRLRQPLSGLVSQLPQAVMRAGRLKSVPAQLGETFVSRIAQDSNWRVQLDPSLSDPRNIDTTDGTRLNFSDGSIIHFRQSGNAPELRCYVETRTKAQTDALLELMLSRSRTVLDALAS